MAKRKILLVEDEPSLAYLVKQNLEYEGYEVVSAEDGAAALDCADKESPDLILLDLMLPKISGMEVCKTLRSRGNNVPIIMVTAKGESIDKVMGLKSGADDYIAKPFDILELTARIEALLRRSGQVRPQEKQGALRIGAADVDFAAGVIRRDGKEMELTRVEAQLLRYFIDHAGEVLPREKIMGEVWGHEYLNSTRTIDTHVTHLRQKIETNPGSPEHIVTVHRVGYKFIR